MKDQVQVSDKTKLSMPIANLIGLIMIVASAVFMYSEITNRLTSLETSRELFESDLLKKVHNYLQIRSNICYLNTLLER